MKTKPELTAADVLQKAPTAMVSVEEAEQGVLVSYALAAQCAVDHCRHISAKYPSLSRQADYMADLVALSRSIATQMNGKLKAKQKLESA